MREAILLGDKFLVEMVLLRLAEPAHPSMVHGVRSKVISFPNMPLPSISACPKPQNMWVTAFLTAMIPFGISLLLMVFHYLSTYLPGFCPAGKGIVG